MSVVLDEIQRQKPPKAIYYRLTKHSALGLLLSYPSANDYYRTSQMPGTDLAPGKYGILYFDQHLQLISVPGSPSVEIPVQTVSAEGFWKKLPDVVHPATAAKQLQLPVTEANGMDNDEDAAPAAARSEPASTKADSQQEEAERVADREMQLIEFQHRMLMRNQKLQREQLATKEIGEVYNHQHSARIEIHVERQLWMEERRDWMRLQMEAEKKHAERQKVQLEMMTTTWEAMEKNLLTAIARHSAPPPPPPDYTPVLMQALVTFGGLANTFMTKDKKHQPELASVAQKLLELGSPTELAKAFSADPNKLADFLKNIQDAFKTAAPSAVPDTVQALTARLEEVKKQLEASGGTQPKEPTTKVVES